MCAQSARILAIEAGSIPVIPHQARVRAPRKAGKTFKTDRRASTEEYFYWQNEQVFPISLEDTSVSFPQSKYPNIDTGL